MGVGGVPGVAELSAVLPSVSACSGFMLETDVSSGSDGSCRSAVRRQRCRIDPAIQQRL